MTALHCVRLNRERASKSGFWAPLRLVCYMPLAHYLAAAFWQPLRSNTQHLGLSNRAALDF